MDTNDQALLDANLVASFAAGGGLTVKSLNGTKFQISGNESTSATLDLGFGIATTGGSFAVSTTQGAAVDRSSYTPVSASPFLNPGSVNQSSSFTFKGLQYGSDSQSVAISMNDSSGVQQTVTSTLNYSNATDIDQAIKQINSDLQATNNPLLQSIVAVKTSSSTGSDGIMFQSAQGQFTVTLGAVNAHGISSATTPGGLSKAVTTSGSTTYNQNVSENSSTPTGNGTSQDISTQAGASGAVTQLANAVAKLGTAQANVGKGQNQFSYAVNLAQSQLGNLAAAESRIRDADLASESANLTKAQILVQAGVAALAQANSAPQQVLSLLRG